MFSDPAEAQILYGLAQSYFKEFETQSQPDYSYDVDDLLLMCTSKIIEPLRGMDCTRPMLKEEITGLTASRESGEAGGRFLRV